MDVIDLGLGPIYLVLVYMLAFIGRSRLKKDDPLRQYYIRGLTLKLFGGIAAGIVYFFYYKTGDTVFYFYRSKILYEVFQGDFSIFLRLLTEDPFKYDQQLNDFFKYLIARDTSAWFLVRIIGVLNIFTFGSYAADAILISYFSFLGICALYRTLIEMYPEQSKEMAVACFFIPSVFFWGSGVFKDAITLLGVCLMTRASYQIFIKGKSIAYYFFIFVIAFYVTFKLKAYIALCFIPSLMFWIFFTYGYRIKSSFLRSLIMPVILVMTIGGAYVFMAQAGSANSNWSLDQIQDRAKDMQWWHSKVKDIYGAEGGGGSFYSIGDGSFSISNLLLSFPQAVVVSLFRPFLWEVRSPVMLLASIEGLVLLVFTIKLIRGFGISKIFKYSKDNPFIFFCLFFAMIFGFAVGFTSFNFGALVRYKIPLMPFYVAGLYLIRYQATKDKKLEELARTEK
ncbi:MAG: hypothetical protein SFW35_13910 [Chitinophagales bacterium]|nr:hypothetical protein [Chitinophagales bacterium]